MTVGFDFSGGTLPTGATLTRASSGTRINVSGARVSETTNVARFDYHPTSHALLGLLVEPASTNPELWSQDFSNAAYALYGGTTHVSTGIRETAVTNIVGTYQSQAIVSGDTMTGSVEASELSGSAKRYLALRMQNNAAGGGNAVAVFDLAAGTFLQGTALTGASMVAGVGGAYICSITAVQNATTTNASFEAFLTTAYTLSIASYLGVVGSGMNLSEFQFEKRPAPSSRIRTTTAAVTRAADVLTLNWGLLGVADQIVTARYTFDDLSTQDVPTTISGGTSAVPTSLSRPRIRTIVGLGLIVPDTFNNPAIFPILPGQTFPVTKSPIWSTKSATASSGRKRKRMMWSYPKWQFKITHDFLRDTASFPELQRLYAFFNIHAGMYGQFSFYDPNDNTVTDQPFGTGDGVTTAFQLTRTLGAGAITFVEPVQSVVAGATAKIAGTPTTAFTISGGIITFTTAPATGAALTWSGQFMFLVEFEQDQFDADQMMQTLWSQSGLTLLSVKS